MTKHPLCCCSIPLVLAALFALSLEAGAESLAWRFTPGCWKQEEWVLVKSPRFDHFGKWVQQEDCIRNEVPAGVSPDDLLGKRAGETYTSMVYAKPFTGDLRVTAELSFAHRMAPLVVLAPSLGKDAAGRPEYREHFEICVYDEGVNVWHHTFADGKPSWKKAAFTRFPLKPNTHYTLDVELKGKQMSVAIDGHAFGYIEEALPKTVYAGITGCEGVNAFYGMTASEIKAGSEK